MPDSGSGSGILREFLLQQAKTLASVRHIERRSAAQVARDIRRTLGPGLTEERLRFALVTTKTNQTFAWRRTRILLEDRQLQVARLAARQSLATDVDLFKGAPGGDQYLSELRRGYQSRAEVLAEKFDPGHERLRELVRDNSVRSDRLIDRTVIDSINRGETPAQTAERVRELISPSRKGGISYNAARLAQSENARLFHSVHRNLNDEKPWIRRTQWNLSATHSGDDECDEFASGGDEGDGVYSTDAVPEPPHPWCMCYLASVQVSQDEFNSALVSGEYDSYISKVARAA